MTTPRDITPLPKIKYAALGSEGGAIYHDVGVKPLSKKRDEYLVQVAPIFKVTNNFDNWDEWGKYIVKAANLAPKLAEALDSVLTALMAGVKDPSNIQIIDDVIAETGTARQALAEWREEA